MDTEAKQRERETVKQTKAVNQLDLTDIYRSFYLKTKEYTFFSAPHGKFSNIDHIVDDKTILNRHKKIEIIPCILLKHPD